MDAQAAAALAGAVTLGALAGAGLYLGRRVTSAVDFTLAGRRGGVTVVAGTIMGTLVGGASTIGTAQLAFAYGLSAWWFTLGAGLGCALLATAVAGPVRRAGYETIPQVLVAAYGPRVGPVSAILSAASMFLTIVGQLLAAIALVTAVVPVPSRMVALAVAVAAAMYVFSGIRGTGLLGLAKIGLLYAGLAASGIVAYALGGGLAGLRADLPDGAWFNLFGRGLADADAAMSMVLGVLCTQTYFQALAAASDARTAQRGAWLCAVVIPPVGVAGVVVGLFMRVRLPELDPALALPTFVTSYMPPVVAGVILATLLVATIGTAAGMALGISTVLTRDVYQRWLRGRATDHGILRGARVAIVVVLTAATVVASGRLGDFILTWVFLSFALRGSAVCIPLLAALFFRTRVRAEAGLAAVVAAPGVALAAAWLGPAWMHAGYVGLVVSAAVLFLAPSARPSARVDATARTDAPVVAP